MPKSREWWLLAVGFALLVLSQTRWGVGALAWVASAPLLAALRARPGWRFRAVFAGLSVVAWTLATLKIVTTPIPPVLAFGYGIPLALVHLPAFLIWDRLVRVGRDGLSILSFAAASSLAEWVQAELTPLGVWGAAPTTQVGNLAVLQVLALVGMPGLAFLIHLVGAALEAAWSCRLRRPAAVAIAVATAITFTWGAFRAAQPIPGPEVRAATIRTESTFGGLPIPPADELRRVNETLFSRTAAAAAAGARLVVWTEGATLVLPNDEPAFGESAAAAARTHAIELVISYIVPISTSPLEYENKARWFAPNGSERLAYLKHRPVPFEPAVAGRAPASAFATSFGRASAAICYDYDFPAVGRVHARTGAGLVAVPSSDWRGIDPIHTEMAAMRAIEGGYSILRSTRFGLSAGIDAHGRHRAQVSTNESLEPFLLVSLPTTQVSTLYTTLGNGVLVPLLAILAWSIAALVSACSGVGATRARRRAGELGVEVSPSQPGVAQGSGA